MNLRQFIKSIFGSTISDRVCGLEGLSKPPLELPVEGLLDIVGKSGVSISGHWWKVAEDGKSFSISGEESCRGGTFDIVRLYDMDAKILSRFDISDVRLKVRGMDCDTNLIGDGDEIFFSKEYAI